MISQAHNAEKASEHAYSQWRTMLPGCPGYREMEQLAIAHRAKSDKESVFIQQVVNIGGTLPIPLKELCLETNGKKHYCLEVRAVAEYVLGRYPQKLLAGFSADDFACFQSLLEEYWQCYKKIYQEHPVFEDHKQELGRCIPIKLHSDEGTGLRKTAVYQFSWGPILSDGAASWDRYLFWSCMSHEDYKEAHAGFERGNSVLDELCSHLAAQAASMYREGLETPWFGKLYFVWCAHEGDLPAQARAYHCKRNFNCVPNPMCVWCSADDSNVPYTDFRQQALWRTTLGDERPWTNPSPLTEIPGARSEQFLSKDLFHICHLGIVRGFVINLICYLVHAGHFEFWQRFSCKVCTSSTAKFYFCCFLAEL